jgi:cell division protein ZipA
MNELRWILLVAGLVLIGAIYVWGARSRRRTTDHAATETRQPVFTGSATSFERPVMSSQAAAEEDAEMERRLTVPAAARRIEPSLTLDESEDEVGGVYAQSGRDRVPASPSGARREPTVSFREEPAAAPPVSRPAVPEPVPEAEPAASAAELDAAPAPNKVPRNPQKIVAVRVTAGTGAKFDGDRLLEALHNEGLRFGRYEIFHRLHDDGRPVISVASLREPGSFDVDAMPGTPYPGVALFTVLPGPLPVADAFDDLLFTARSLATQLGGVLADERGTPLTAHRVMRMREDALEFGRVSGSA